MAAEASNQQDARQQETQVNGNGEEQAQEQGQEQAQEGEGEPAAENVFQLTIKLPHAPGQCQIMVSQLEQVQDIRQSIIDLPFTFQYSCFHLEHQGKRINDFVELSEVPGVAADPVVHLVEDAYTETQARMHFVRIRELIGASGDRTDLLHGIQAGLSLHDDIVSPLAASEGPQNDQKDSTPIQHAMTDYDIDAPGLVKSLLPPPATPAPKTVKGIALSPWNPPPYTLRQKGHLMYLLVTTNEGEQHHVTSHVSGFFVNKSTNNKFDPFPRTAPKPYSAHSLLNLLTKLSPSFEKSFQELQEFNGQKDPLSAYQVANAIPASPWVVSPEAAALSSHVADVARTQESYLLSGPEMAETLRDWNEEFQSTRELPKETVQDRVFRERLTSKLFAEYNEAAVKGAILVARGEVAPLNPTEARDAQIYVYNNVFYSFGADGVGTFAADGGDEAARVATGKDVLGVKAVNQLDINGLFTPGTVVVDYLGKRLVGQSIVPGIFKQREPGEHQIDYGGVEGKDVIAEHEGFKAPFAELSKAVRVKSHPVWDKENVRHDLEGSVETKGLLGTDGRKYVLDLYRITPLDVAWLQEHRKDGVVHEDTYPHRMAVLRPELVESYWRLKLREYVQAEVTKRREARKAEAEAEKPNGESTSGEVAGTNGAEKKEPEQERVDVSAFHFSLNPDVYCGQRPQSQEEKAEWAKDEEEVLAACKYLTGEVIPKMISDLQEGDVGFPMDGQSLTSLLHKRGINLRYLGDITRLADKDDPRLQALKQLSTQEMIARAFKHVVSKPLKYLSPVFAQACIAHLLNCLLGAELNAKPTAETDSALKKLYPEEDFSWEQITPEAIKADITRQVKLRFRFDLDGKWIESGKQLQLLRDVCLKLGFQLEAKDYAFTEAASVSTSSSTASLPVPATNGESSGSKKKKGKKHADHSPARAASVAGPVQTFHPDNVLNIVPIVKEASPRSVLAEEALEAGRISLAQDQKDLGQELLLESLSLHEQIYGILHPEVARVYYALSTLYYGLDEKSAAVELARKAVIISERTLGVDHAETVLSYLNLSLFEHASGNTKNALSYVRHALDLWKVVYGLKHPDSITTINNAAVMLQSLKQYHESRQWFEASLAISEEVSGKQSVNTATLLFQLAQALALDRDSKGAVNKMREAFNIFKAELGPEDRNTKEAEAWLESLTQSAVSLAKHAKTIQERKLLLRPRAPRVAMGARPQPQVGQSAAEAMTPTTDVHNSNNGMGQRSIDDLVKYINGEQSKSSSSKKKQTNPKRRQQRA
ncbi:hypothetical protein AAFC00_004614 [Neodothiora populina]|uniref:Clustered mitochondria protein homolog n=1 Tax=Neodothiora populina TaxID=2781224 RepID=A0ABR3P3Z8_9PEZI